MGSPRSLIVTGDLDLLDERRFEDADDGGGTLFLAAHLGPWEAGASELARRGQRPMVLASPWPRLPRSAAELARLRARHGVRTAFRGREGWREATEWLRSGGTVVALVDSLSADPSHRRALRFVGSELGAPEALLRWADRQGAITGVAVGAPDGFGLHRLWGEDRSRVCVELLDQGVRRNPSAWAWVHALAGAVLALPSLLLFLLLSVSGSLSACSSEERLPPLPSHPEEWFLEAEGLRWHGLLGKELRGELRAARGTGRIGDLPDQAVDMKLETIRLRAWSRDTGLEILALQAERFSGRWPEGPASFTTVLWTVPSAETLPDLAALGSRGKLERVDWTALDGFACGGCPLEGLKGDKP